MAVGERDHRAAGCQTGQSGDRIGSETGLGLLPVAHHRATERLQPLDRLAYRLFADLADLITADTAFGVGGHRVQQRGGARDAADRLRRDRHAASIKWRTAHINARQMQICRLTGKRIGELIPLRRRPRLVPPAGVRRHVAQRSCC